MYENALSFDDDFVLFHYKRPTSEYYNVVQSDDRTDQNKCDTLNISLSLMSVRMYTMYVQK